MDSWWMVKLKDAWKGNLGIDGLVDRRTNKLMNALMINNWIDKRMNAWIDIYMDRFV